ncbi:hypothetical protein GGR56DRAFT_111303 [Xylariaceae sp. FL0804]|nr:hypothetical protein GGR56DRAFT_111303 [Xylariaceae sp. FL0804]
MGGPGALALLGPTVIPRACQPACSRRARSSGSQADCQRYANTAGTGAAVPSYGDTWNDGQIPLPGGVFILPRSRYLGSLIEDGIFHDGPGGFQGLVRPGCYKKQGNCHPPVVCSKHTLCARGCREVPKDSREGRSRRRSRSRSRRRRERRGRGRRRNIIICTVRSTS